MTLEYIFTTYANDWKSMVIHVTENYLSPNAQVGFKYLSIALQHDVCEECYDKFAHDWLEDFAAAWICKKELPIFYHRCWERNLI